MGDGPELRYARASDGVTIAYQLVGSGPVVVWLPALSHVVAQWRVPLLRTAYEHLARSTTLVLYDGRGMGSSDRRVDLDDLGLDAHVRDLVAVVESVVESVGEQPVALLGYYHSVPTALAFAAARPRQVSRLVLFGGGARLRDVTGPAQTQALLSLVDQDWQLFTESAAHAWLGWSAGESGRLLAESFRAAATQSVARAWFAAAAGIDVTELVPRVSTPALVLHRAGDGQMPVEVSRRLADALANATLLELPGTWPTLFHEDARGDLDLVTRFLTTGTVPRRPPPGTRSGGVTARELDVLRRLAAGDSNAEIARNLGIAVHTVERHTANLYRKIGARGRADATAYALRHGFA